MNTRILMVLAVAAATVTGCTTPDPGMRSPPEALGASSGASGSGTVGFSSAGADASNADYWKIDAK